ncbi:hypothetical protein RB608_18900 [Nocardioides sp. LHD-245]|uniref:hypothetical protein n=1 Tax=Nocardioides sp. LHD-245 TaxID=3051387 RepID=UPI0027E0B667|nr:hypothetical protein [Nocardioides sp. LHD-245]
MTRITINVDDDTGSAIREAAASAGESVSAWMSRAAEMKLRNQLLGKALDDYEAEYGAFTEEELAKARALFRQKPARWTEEPST